MKISDDVLDVLGDLTLDGLHVTLARQLDRALYLRVNQVLEAAGGKWHKGRKAHVFAADPAPILDQVVLTGAITAPQDLGYFPTPPAVVRRMLGLLDLRPGDRVLEPSAGGGALAAAVRDTGKVTRDDLVCVELDEVRARELRLGNLVTYPADFLACRPEDVPPDPFRDDVPAPGPVLGTFNRIIMDPPFARQQDLDHVRHARSFLRPRGRLVAVMAAGVTFRTNRRTEDFRAALAADGGTLAPLPEGSFRVRKTDVSTVLCVWEHPR